MLQKGSLLGHGEFRTVVKRTEWGGGLKKGGSVSLRHGLARRIGISKCFHPGEEGEVAFGMLKGLVQNLGHVLHRTLCQGCYSFSRRTFRECGGGRGEATEAERS